MRYADPTLCPDCRSALPAGVPVCPTCQLLVRHPLAIDLFRTLRRADTLVAELRETSNEFHGSPVPGLAPVPVPAPVPAQTSVTVGALGGPLVPPGAVPAPKRAPGPPPPPPPSPTAPMPPMPPRRGVAFASVPKILLGLGAFCLLVAAVIFLAVSWSTLGVGGRTAVLALFTLTAGSSALLLHRAGLRIAGESLIVVALGLLALDVFGAGAADWLGKDTDGGIGVTAGLVVAAAGVALGMLRIPGQPRLVAPQIIAGIGVAVAYFGALGVTDHHLLVSHAAVALIAAVVVLGRSQGMAALQWSMALAGVLPWLGAGSIALTNALSDPDLEQLWLDSSGWSLLVTAAALLVPGLVLRNRTLLLAGASGAATVVTVVITLPCIDTDATTFGLVAVAATAIWVTAFGLLPRALRAIAIAPASVGSALLTGLALTTFGFAIARWADIGSAFDRSLTVMMGRVDPVTEPLLLVPSLIVPIAFLALLVAGDHRNKLVGWAQAAAVTAGVGVAATVASYDVALAVPVAVLVLLAIGAAAVALTATGTRAAAFGAVAVATTVVTSVAAIPSASLTAIVAGAAALVAVALALRGTEAIRPVGALVTAPQLALSVSAAIYAFGAGAEWIAIPAMLAVGVLALALPRIDIELPAIAAAVLTFPISLAATSDAGAYGAVWFTVAGFLVCATALIHESRRPCAWAGSALLFIATWIRLADLDVREPEAYTAPLAVALLALGLWQMQKSTAVGTAQALLPSLLLGTIPSLLWVLDDPVSLRALILGAVCLTITIAGAALRWSAPLMVGASVGAILVFRELGAYPGEFPKWVWIGLAGLLLTVVGITWERQLLEVRKVVGYLGRLR